MAEVYKAVCGNILGAIHKWNDLCCLCFNSVDEDAISVNDHVVIGFNPSDEKLLEDIMSRILISVLGNSVAENLSIFQLVCKKCSQDAITSYKFMKSCKENSENLLQAVNDLTDCFEIISEDSTYKTLYISVDPTTNTIEQICDVKKQTCPQDTALERFRFLSGQSQISHVKAEYQIESNEETTRGVAPRQRDVSTIFIKTHELVADPSHPKDYKCKICLKDYPSSGSLRQHFFSKHFKKDYQCPECQKSFGTSGLLQSHIQISHQVVQCLECGKKLLNRASTLKRHAETHQKSKRICYRCGRSYKKLRDYENHLAQETCEVPSRTPGEFACEYCNQVFTFKCRLVAHIKFEHLGEEGFVCKWCNKKYYTASALKVHIVTHTKEKKFICPQCGGKFVTKQSLTNHLRLHTGERPYKCNFCDSGFLSASRRKDHVARYHNEAIFACKLCPAKYTARRSLQKHKKRHSRSLEFVPLHLEIATENYI